MIHGISFFFSVSYIIFHSLGFLIQDFKMEEMHIEGLKYKCMKMGVQYKTKMKMAVQIFLSTMDKIKCFHACFLSFKNLPGSLHSLHCHAAQGKGIAMRRVVAGRHT